MGNNAAFTTFEATVIAVYNRGCLDKELLAELAEAYAESNIDWGGDMEGLRGWCYISTLTKDGLDIYGVILKVYGIDVYGSEIPPKWKELKELQYDAVRKIQKEWGW